MTERLQRALEQVQEPLFERSLGKLKIVPECRVSGNVGSLKMRLSAPGQAYRDRLEQRLKDAAKSVGIARLEVQWDLQVPIRQMNAEDPMPDVRNVILVTSGKGGVGKSTCAANLALAAARGGARVGLLDADIYGPSIPTMMGVSEPPTSKDGKKIEPLEQHGIKLMSIGFMLEDPRAAIVWRGPMLHGALQQFLSDVNWGTLDYLFMDLPPGTGDVALTLAQRVRVTGVVVVTTPQEVALQDVYKAVSMCKKLNLPILGVVENMSHFVDSAGVTHELFGRGGGQLIADFAEAPLLGQIPLDPLVREWGDGGSPVVRAAPESPIGKSFIEVAETLTRKVTLNHFEQAGGVEAPNIEAPRRLRIVRS